MQPFALLLDIAERSRRNASALPQQTEAVRYWRGVGFMLAGRHFMADMADVAEILQPPRLTKVPGVRNWVLGVANVRGRLVPVMDLAGLLGLPSKANWRSRRVLVIEQDDHLSGLLVDAVLGMQQFPVDSRNDNPDLAPEFAKFVSHSYQRDGSDWPVFELRDLIQAQEFLEIAV
ncbi:MAG: chemotaxis protein CheW [Oceanospirillaceae bacterium]|uniref:chemotaxis protein CheW n=1 Tax=unclassified Thalassolituus TaxID=2624967 RepID=UPI000C4DEEBB|nr:MULTISPECIES: chemotaxis protein CheW [unclassified Thalassolituus]MAS26199.1 chemotaxis protein CheW [Oceanospirillaceae bacterium]MAX98904.1 chemotaxis protein CheW [Oceanospirillaceae bacterium]MBL33311.1 chemotaxis protein CheW [Oceanospirillaceae bacterium]MBS54389.1 chemotaxis protein CheW [Oceanospirillaceae bacterium]|tara:strand:+ start:9951 stop:10475 length:525 start_codon:yes stop_codon:yes gene_type:complete